MSLRTLNPHGPVFATYARSLGHPPSWTRIRRQSPRFCNAHSRRSLKSVIACGSVATGDFVWCGRERIPGRGLTGRCRSGGGREATGRRQAGGSSPLRLAERGNQSPLFHMAVHSPRSVRSTQTQNRRDAVSVAVRLKAGSVQLQRAAAREAFFFNLWKPLLRRATNSCKLCDPSL